MTDIAAVKDLAARAGGLAQAMKRSGKFTGNDYYHAAETKLWAEWRGGCLLRAVELGSAGRPPKNLSTVERLGLDPLLKKHSLGTGTAYRWIHMSWCPNGELSCYIAKQQDAKQELKSRDVVRLGKAHMPVELPPGLPAGYQWLP